jgi:protein TonB
MNRRLALIFMAEALLAQEADDKIYNVGRDITPPAIISKSEPEYGDEARKAQVNSTVTMSLVIGRDGSLEDIQIVKGAGFGLDEKAIESIRQWKFKPGA